MAVNAFIQPVMAQYLGSLRKKLAENWFIGDNLILQCKGGLMSADTAMERPVLRQNIIGIEVIAFPRGSGHNRRTMLAAILYLSRVLLLIFGGHRAVALENLALRQQPAIYKRKSKRPRLARRDRWFWILLSRVWEGWRRALIIVHPDTVVRWHRKRFRKYWAELSRGRKPGRPPTAIEIRELIRTIATENPLWRAPRIHGELLKLGITISERTVSRILRTVKNPHSQTWKTFFNNHIGEIISIHCCPVNARPTSGN